MNFYRLGRAASRSARSTFQSSGFLGAYGGRSALLNESLLRSPYGDACFHSELGGFGFLRGYLTSIGANKDFILKNYSSDLNFPIATPGIRRFFSSEAPKKKNYENFYPKDKKEIPKGGERSKSESKEDANTDNDGNFQESFMKQLQSYLTPLLFIGLVLSSFSFGPHDQKQISFQEFKISFWNLV